MKVNLKNLDAVISAHRNEWTSEPFCARCKHVEIVHWHECRAFECGCQRFESAPKPFSTDHALAFTLLAEMVDRGNVRICGGIIVRSTLADPNERLCVFDKLEPQHVAIAYARAHGLMVEEEA